MTSYRPHYFEDLEEGETFETGARTVSQSLVDQYSMVSGDWAEHHANRQYAEDSIYGDRVAHGFLVFSMGTGLLYQSGVFNHTLGTVTDVRVRFTNPTYVGDTISVEFTIREKIEGTPFDDMGKVRIKARITNQEDDLVCLTDAGFYVEYRNPDEHD